MRTNLRAGEEIALVARRHWLVMGWPLAISLFLQGCFVAAWFVQRPWLLPAAAVLLGISTLWLIWRWADWRCDLWAVTSQRVIDEQGVLAVRVVDSPLDTIHNVTCTQTLLGRVMNYGTVKVQTAAEQGSTTIPHAAGPADVRESILELKERYRQGLQYRVTGVTGPAAADDTKECPFCAETIKARATVCRFCGRSV